MRNRHFRSLAIAAATAAAFGLVLTGCTGSPEPVQTGDGPAPITVKFGDLGVAAQAGTYIAMEKGYFEEQGITVELVHFNTGADQIPALSTGEIDVGVGTISGGLFNAVSSGIPLKIVADQGGTIEGAASTALVVRKDLIDSGEISTFADLAGRNIAISCTGCVSEILIDAALRKGNLTLEDANIERLAFPQMVTALENGSIDVALTTEPFGTNAVDQGIATQWKRGDELIQGKEISTILYGPGFAADTDAGQRFMIAYLQGMRDYIAAFFDGVGKDEVIDILTQYTAIKDPEMFEKMEPTGFRADGSVSYGSISDDLDWLVARGVVTNPPDLSQVIDESFVEYANEQLSQMPG